MKNKPLILSILLTSSIATNANDESTAENNEDINVIPPFFIQCDPKPECFETSSSRSFLQWSMALITKEKEPSMESIKKDQKSEK